MHIFPKLASLLHGRSPLIAIMQVGDADHAEPLLEALESAGVVAIEVTLRTPAALKVIERMCRAATTAVVGAGTLTLPDHFKQVRDVGAKFAVSPALTESLVAAAVESGLPFVPGAATPSEILQAREFGLHELKFFPSELLGGTAWLKHMQPLFPDVRFCPTGGINNENVSSFLALDNVFAVGGAYFAPWDMVAEARWREINATATRAVAAVSAERPST